MVSSKTTDETQWLEKGGELFCFQRSQQMTVFGEKEVITLTRFLKPLPDSIGAIKRELKVAPGNAAYLSAQSIWLRFNKIYRKASNGFNIHRQDKVQRG
jgi:hypothetical protein